MTAGDVQPPGPLLPSFRRTLTAVRNVAASYAGTIVEGGAFLLVTPFLVRRLGLAAFGLWSLAVALAEWLQLLDLGLRDAVMKYAAAHQARAEATEVRRLADTALLLYAVLGAVALLGVAGFGWLGLPLVVPQGTDVAGLLPVFLILGLSTALSLPAGLTGSMLEGFSRFDLINLFRAGHAMLRLVLIVVALQLDLGLVGLATAELTSRVALYVARWTAVYRLDPELVPWPRLHAGQAGKLFGFGLWSALRQSSELAANRLCEPLVAVLAGSAAVGAFVVGRRLATMSAELIVPMAGVLFPLSSEMDARGRLDALRQTLLKSTKFAFFAGVPIALVLAIGARPIQVNWLGNRAPEVEPVLSVFAVAFLLVAVSLPSEVILAGLGYVRLLAYLGLAQVAIILGTGIRLTSHLGAPGLALGWLAAVVVVQIAIQIPVAARKCGLPLMLLVRRSVLPAALAGAPVGLVMLVLRDPIAGGGLASLATWAGGASMTYALLYWWIGLDGEERAFLRSHLDRLLLHPSRIQDWDDPP